MIKFEIIHPQLLAALASCGHKSQILIADSNYACRVNANADATLIHLNLAPGMVPATYIVEKLLTCVNVEHATLMALPPEFTNTIASEYRKLLPTNCPLEFVERQAFYAKSRLPLTQLVIASGEQRRFANLLLAVAPA